MDKHLYQHFLSLLDVKHVQELKDTDKVLNEYHELENVPPAPGQPNRQHDTMVQNGKFINFFMTLIISETIIISYDNLLILFC